ncbi:MAG TPA: methylmalonyl-CoA mutase family protein [Propionibacteriaceae bacterium]|nr:methylmalonyl-CoA mutase family protein [Propionibacteriaceae bacterium]
MSDTTTVLAGDFATPTREQWDTEVLKVLNRRRPPGTELTIDKAMARLRTTTVDGLTIEPLYTATEAPALGVPGSAPFTRGTTVRNGAALAWDVRQLHEDPSATATNAAVLEDLRVGGTSVWLRLGEGGIAPADLPEALAGVITGLAPVAVSSTSDQAAAADALLAWWGDATDARGNLGIDPIGLAALQGTTPDLSQLAAYVSRTAHLPGVKPIVVDVRVYDDAGAGDVDQLAYAVATGIEYVRALVAAGVSAADAFGALEFRVAVNADQFLGIARLRALRRLWSRVGEVLDVPVEARGAIQHAVTSWRMVTRDDPWVNLLRGTIATFAAAVGGADIITTLPFDTAQGLPNAFSRRMARNTQLVAAEESNLGRVEDPAGGSWYVETLTDDVAHAAWSRVQELEAAGGMAAALAAGTIAAQIGATTAERRKRLSSRKQPITGVSMFPPEQESPIEGLDPRPTIASTAGLKPARDSEVFEGLRDRVSAQTKATGTQPAVFLACLGARRDFGPREQFTSNVLLVAGLAHPSSEGGTPEEIVEQVKASGAKQVILCSSGKVYAAQAIAVADALKKAGVHHVWIAGKKTETGSEDVDSVIDGEVFDGMDVVGFLSDTLDRLGVAK